MNTQKLKTNIVNITELLSKKLNIPPYQRPYKWSEKNINQLIDDILFFNNKEAYRLGTIVLHKDNNKLNIVDGQQRTISLLLLYYAIKDYNKENKNLKIKNIQLNFSFNSDISKSNVQKNYLAIKRRVKEFDEKTVDFLFNKCEVVIVILKNLTEAFQFFDSQNARGKDLEPHDLLKAFHLREMKNIPEDEKVKIVKTWEDMNSEELADLFSKYLYRIRNWSKNNSARFFTKNDIDIFKGIDLEDNNKYNFYKIYTVANYYIDDYNKSYNRNIDNNQLNYPFQIDQTIINGKRFFEMISYYQKELKELNKTDNEIIKLLNSYESKIRTGDKYTRNLFDCILFYYIDKFGKVEIDKAIEKIFILAYKLRLTLRSVQIASIDNYAIETKIFNLIREAISHKEVINLQLENITNIKGTNLEKIENKFMELEYVI